jgi:purine-binding chemotaxis protein CheW
MDLAKIRKKCRRPPKIDFPVHSGQEIQITGSDIPIFEPVIAASVSPEIDIPSSNFPEKSAQIPAAAIFPERPAAYRDPIEVILAGRDAAGCDEELPNDEEITGSASENCLEYLCFRVSDEIYGVNIMDIKEITKTRIVTEVPRAPTFVSGIISLRGTIIPIIDMRFRLGLPREIVTGKERIVVIKHDQSFSGLLVDEVIQVVRINKENMEPAPSVLEGIDRDFVSGIGRSEGRLIIILNLESIADIHLY